MTFVDSNCGLTLFEDSQCQAIHARSVFPCQDTPDVKSSFQFNIRSPLPVIASGLATGIEELDGGRELASRTKVYTFEQAIPIPSYLFALASGWVVIWVEIL